MAAAASSLGELRRAIRSFLQDSGGDPKYRAVAGELRSLDQKLGDADTKAPDQTPGQKAAGVEPPSRGGDDTGSPGSRAARTPGGESKGSPRDSARQLVGADSAKGQSNLPPFMRREQMKRKATARKGS